MRPFRPIVCTGCLLALWLVVFSGPGARVSAQANERDVFVTVLNEAGAPVTTLGITDFIVREDGVSREILRARKAADPIDLTLLVDNTQAASRHLTDLRKALKSFVDTMMKMDPHGEMSFVGYADRPTILVNYTRSAAELTRAVERFFPVPSSGAYLMDALVEISRGIEKRDSERPVIVALSADAMELSYTYHQQVTSSVAASGAALHVITLDNQRDMAGNENRERALAFAQATKMSGGRYDNILTSMSLDKKLSDVANELANQYRVTYARPQQLIPPERVDVAVRKAGLVARGTPLRVRTPKLDSSKKDK